MKKWIVGFILGVVTFTSCEDFEGINVSLDDLGISKLNLMQNYLEDQNLVISKFIVGGEDLTSEFSGYEFLFSQSGDVSAVFAGDTVLGNWNVELQDSIPKMTMAFGEVSEPLEKLNEDWLLIKQENDLLELKDINSKDGNMDYLTFMKI